MTANKTDIHADQWLTRKEAAAYLTSIGCPIAAGTLENLACNNNAGGGPSYRRTGWRTVRYHTRDLEKWAWARVIQVE
jgi:hypothetical protein